MFKFTFLNRDKEIQEEYGLGKYNEKRKKKTFAEKYLSLHKVIYTDPIDTPKEQVLDERSYLQAVDDQRMVLNIRSYSLFELLFILPFFVLFFYLLIYMPISDYSVQIDVVQELVETGKSSYSYEITNRYGSEASVEHYKRGGISYRLFILSSTGIIIFIFMGLMACIGFSFWAYIVTKNCRDLLTFNRQDGTVLYRYNYGLKTSICQFNDSIFQSHLASLTNADSTYLAMRFPNVKGYATLSRGVPYISMSFYVWYMDKNRPLPPGTAFDPYREQDYLRRREEGFPDPLYPSGIPTPEWDGAITKYDDKGAKSRKLKMYDPEFKQVAYAEDQFRKSQTKKTDI